MHTTSTSQVRAMKLIVALTTQSPSKEWTTSSAVTLSARSLMLSLELALPTAHHVSMTGLLFPQAASGKFPSVSLKPLLVAGLGIRGAKAPVPTQLKCTWECKRARARITPCTARKSRHKGQQRLRRICLNRNGSALLQERLTTRNPMNSQVTPPPINQRSCAEIMTWRPVKRWMA